MPSNPPFSWALPYPSRRSPVLAANVVATSQPLAVQAGMRAFERGGNAVDAALAAAIALVVVEPTNNGIGSDAFALVWDGAQLHGLNGSGCSPAELRPECFDGLANVPLLGWDAVTVPGAVAAWSDLSRRFGRLPFADLFEPAIRYARDGYPVSPIVAEQWEMVAGMYADFPGFAAAFLPRGRAPAAGQRFALRELAETLEDIAATHGESLYRGPLAERAAAYAQGEGAALKASDLAEHRSEWVEPIAIDYRGHTLHEIPPNTQGIAALIALGVLSHFDMASLEPDGADALHLQIEAMKVGLAAARRWVGDPRVADVPVRRMLDARRIAKHASSVALRTARSMDASAGSAGDTVYLTTADAQGMMVSYIQSNYFAFGSGVVVPGTGISLQNRGACFTLEPGHPNCVGPRRRPLQTIIPAFVTEGGEPRMSFGVMGGPMQPQGHVQMLVRILDYGQNPQAAIDAPRWQVFDGLRVGVEPGYRANVLDELRERGHELSEVSPAAFGGAQAIWRMRDGYLGASDWRKDGAAAGV